MLFPVLGFANDTTFVDVLKKDICLKNVYLSIIIPYYERPVELHKCLEALTRQNVDLKRIEVIVVDDGSSDCSVSENILKAFSNYFYKTRCIYQSKDGYGLSRARNNGIMHALFSYILILDCDILATTDMVEQHLKACLVSPKVVSLGFRNKRDITNEEVNSIDFSAPIPIQDLDWRVSRLGSSKMSNDIWKLCSGGNLCAHRSVFYHLFDERFKTWGAEDNEWGYRVWKAGYYFYFNIEACSYHLVAGGFQTDREAGRSISQQLLKELCPRYDNQTMYTVGEIPLISIIITIFNKKDYLQQAVDSALKIPFRKEIILVDNNSTDGSLDLARKISSQNPCVKLFCESQQGAFYSFECGLRNSKGEVLIQLDADDILIEDVTVKLIKICLDEPLGIVYANTQVINEDGSDSDISPWRWARCTREDNLINGMHVRNPRVFKRRDLNRCPPRKFLPAATDYNLYAGFFLISYGAFIDQVGLLYRFVDNSITNSDLELQKNSSRCVTKRYRDRLIGKDSLQVIDIINNRLEIVQKTQDVIIYYIDHLSMNRNTLTKSESLISALVDISVFNIEKLQYYCLVDEEMLDLKDRNICAKLSKSISNKIIEPAILSPFCRNNS